MCLLFGELFSNNGIKPHFLSNYLDITSVLIVCSPLFLMPQCHPCLFLSFYWMLRHDYSFLQEDSLRLFSESLKIRSLHNGTTFCLGVEFRFEILSL